MKITYSYYKVTNYLDIYGDHDSIFFLCKLTSSSSSSSSKTFFGTSLSIIDLLHACGETFSIYFCIRIRIMVAVTINKTQNDFRKSLKCSSISFVEIYKFLSLCEMICFVESTFINGGYLKSRTIQLSRGNLLCSFNIDLRVNLDYLLAMFG